MDDPLLTAIDAADRAMVLAVLAAAEVATQFDELEQCLLQARAALTTEESILRSLYASQSNGHIISVLENDVTWKQSLLDAIPLG